MCRRIVDSHTKSAVFTTSRRLRNFDNKYVTQIKPDSTRQYVGKEIKYRFASCATGHAGEKEFFYVILNILFMQ
jgi:hypothetical protein